MHEVAQRPSERLSLDHIINSRGKKMIDIYSIGSGVKCHSLIYWSIVMTSPDFAPKRYEKFFKMA